MKSRADTATVPEIIAAAAQFIKAGNLAVDMIVPVPPSTARAVQPVMLLAQGISAQLGIPLDRLAQSTRDLRLTIATMTGEKVGFRSPGDNDDPGSADADHVRQCPGGLWARQLDHHPSSLCEPSRTSRNVSASSFS